MFNTFTTKVAPDRLPIIKYKSAHAGAGKSKTIFEAVLANPDLPTIIATPTDKLSLQYMRYFGGVALKATVVSRSVNEDFSSRQHLLDAVRTGKKLTIVTQRILHECEADLSAYRIFEDEIFNPLSSIKFERAQLVRPTFQMLLAAEMSVSPRYYVLKLTAAAIEIALGGWKHAVIKDSPDLLLCEAVYSLHHDVYVLADAFNRYLAGEQNDIQFWTILKPSVHAGRDVTFVGAMFEHSLTNLIWEQSVVLKEADLPVNDNGLTYNAALADVRYVFEKNLTGNLLNSAGPKVVFQKAIDADLAPSN